MLSKYLLVNNYLIIFMSLREKFAGYSPFKGLHDRLNRPEAENGKRPEEVFDPELRALQQRLDSLLADNRNERHPDDTELIKQLEEKIEARKKELGVE